MSAKRSMGPPARAESFLIGSWPRLEKSLHLAGSPCTPLKEGRRIRVLQHRFRAQRPEVSHLSVIHLSVNFLGVSTHPQESRVSLGGGELSLKLFILTMPPTTAPLSSFFLFAQTLQSRPMPPKQTEPERLTPAPYFSRLPRSTVLSPSAVLAVNPPAFLLPLLLLPLLGGRP